MKKTINIFNHYHYGDVFYSRSLVQFLSDFFEVNYYHNLKNGLFKDLPNVTEFIGIPNIVTEKLLITDSFVNSWIGAYNVKHNCSFYSYLEIIEKVGKHFNLQIVNSLNFLPKVNYKNLDLYESITLEMLEYKKKFDKIILISTGDVLSGQSHNFNFSEVINKISKEYENILIITTTKILEKRDNVIDTNAITKINPDLLEISLISSFCDIIIGRASGPYCFSQTFENMTDKNKIFISFSNNEEEGVFYRECESKKVWSNDYSLENVYNIIKKEI